MCRQATCLHRALFTYKSSADPHSGYYTYWLMVLVMESKEQILCVVNAATMGYADPIILVILLCKFGLDLEGCVLWREMFAVTWFWRSPLQELASDGVESYQAIFEIKEVLGDFTGLLMALMVLWIRLDYGFGCSDFVTWTLLLQLFSAPPALATLVNKSLVATVHASHRHRGGSLGNQKKQKAICK